MSDFKLIPRGYPKTLDFVILRRLQDIYNFKGFSPFLPSDVLNYVDVYLDHTATKETEVTLAELVKELESLNKEFDILKKRYRKLASKENANQDVIFDLAKNIEDLMGRIRDIENHITKCRISGRDSIFVEIELLGYYTRSGKSGKREIVLLMGTLEKYDPELTLVVFVHELMHAFFDSHKEEHPYCPAIEEPVAEYGMLCFIEMYERMSPSKNILAFALKHVRAKRNKIGLCHYGFGSYLFDKKNSLGADWTTLFHNSCLFLNSKMSERDMYESMISPISYPRSERSCEAVLYQLLRPLNFVFLADARYYSGTIGHDADRILIQVSKDVCESEEFQKDYLVTAPTRINITFEDNKGKRITGGAKIYKGATIAKYMRIYIESDRTLLSQYLSLFHSVTTKFVLYESAPADGLNCAKWEAKEVS